VFEYFVVVALAVEETHHYGLVHGNISFSQVYLNVDHRYDISLGSHMSLTLMQELTKKHGPTYLQKESYLAPELTTTQPSDIYSLGIFLHELTSFTDKGKTSPHFHQSVDYLLSSLLQENPESRLSITDVLLTMGQ